MNGLLKGILVVDGTKRKLKRVLNVFDYTQIKYTEENIVTLNNYQGCRHALSCLCTMDVCIAWMSLKLIAKINYAFIFPNMAARAPPQQITRLGRPD
jgi:hypothetical protein